MSRTRTVLIVLAVLVAAVVAAVTVKTLRGPGVEFGTPYQAILLSNGQAYFGKLEKLGSRYPVLREVYYVQSRVDQQTKAVTNVLVRRGKEWHGPDRMVLNAEHILFVEPVGPDSAVAKLIEELKKVQ